MNNAMFMWAAWALIILLAIWLQFGLRRKPAPIPSDKISTRAGQPQVNVSVFGFFRVALFVLAAYGIFMALTMPNALKFSETVSLDYIAERVIVTIFAAAAFVAFVIVEVVQWAVNRLIAAQKNPTVTVSSSSD